MSQTMFQLQVDAQFQLQVEGGAHNGSAWSGQDANLEKQTLQQPGQQPETEHLFNNPKHNKWLRLLCVTRKQVYQMVERRGTQGGRANTPMLPLREEINSIYGKLTFVSPSSNYMPPISSHRGKLHPVTVAKLWKKFSSSLSESEAIY